MLNFYIFENDLSFVSLPLDLSLIFFSSFNLCLPFKMKYKFHFQNANSFLFLNSLSFLIYKLSLLSSLIQKHLLCINFTMTAMAHHICLMTAPFQNIK